MIKDFDPYKFMFVKHHFIGGIYTKEMHMPSGLTFGSHRHTFDHQSILASGTAIVKVDGVETEYVGPAVINIKARQEHEITGITNIIWMCQHRTDCTDPEEIDIEFIE